MTDRASPGGRTGLEALLAAVPEQVRSRLSPPTGTPFTPDGLARAARDALVCAEAADGAHGGAFDLLAADGFLTLACLAALDTDDADRTLRALLADVTS